MKQRTLKRIQFLLPFLLVFLCTLAASARPLSVSLRGQTYQLQEESIDQQPYVSLESPDLPKLLAVCNAQLQYSSAATSAYFYIPGRNTFWGDSVDFVTVNSQDLKTEHRFVASRKMLSREGLWRSLGLSAFAGDNSGSLKLVPQIVSISPDNANDSVSPIAVRLSTVSKPKVSKQPSQEGLVMEFEDVVWPKELERRLNFREVELEALGGEGPGQTLTVKVNPRPFWSTKALNDLTGTVRLMTEPRHLRSVAQKSAALLAVNKNATAEEASYQLQLDGPVTFSWVRQNDGNLVIELANALAAPGAANLMLPGEMQAVAIAHPSYPIYRFSLPINESQTFQISESTDNPNDHSLTVRLLPKGKIAPPELTGQAAMKGFVGGNGGVVVIDPGHGGGDPGCRNHSLGVCEKDVTLDISLRLQKILESRGFTVVMTRSEDRDVTYAGSPDMMELEARSDVANSINADAFVSIHCNASVNSGARGSAIYYCKPEDYTLAQYMDVLGNSLGFEEQGLLQQRFVVLRTTSMPAVLVETAFLTNPTEGAMLATASVRQAIADRLADGLERYLASEVKPTARRGKARRASAQTSGGSPRLQVAAPKGADGP